MAVVDEEAAARHQRGRVHVCHKRQPRHRCALGPHVLPRLAQRARDRAVLARQLGAPGARGDVEPGAAQQGELVLAPQDRKVSDLPHRLQVVVPARRGAFGALEGDDERLHGGVGEAARLVEGGLIQKGLDGLVGRRLDREDGAFGHNDEGLLLTDGTRRHQAQRSRRAVTVNAHAVKPHALCAQP
eukprot:scaffold36949_cov60-Phaeocystis_antarctica.AAC.1